MTTARRYRAMAERQLPGISPTYERLCLGVADDPQLLARLDTLPAPKRQPNLLLGATPDTLTVLQALPVRTGASRVRVLRYGRPDATRATRVLRYLHERVVRRALHDDARLLERVQQGLANLEPTCTMPLDAAQPGLRWFVERCRAASEHSAPAATRARKRAPRQAPVATAD